MKMTKEERLNRDLKEARYLQASGRTPEAFALALKIIERIRPTVRPQKNPRPLDGTP